MDAEGAESPKRRRVGGRALHLVHPRNADPTLLTDTAEREAATARMVALWREALAAHHSSFVHDLRALVLSHYPSRHRTLLDEVLFAFVVSHPEHMSTILTPLLEMVANGKLPFHRRTSPFPSLMALARGSRKCMPSLLNCIVSCNTSPTFPLTPLLANVLVEVGEEIRDHFLDRLFRDAHDDAHSSSWDLIRSLCDDQATTNTNTQLIAAIVPPLLLSSIPLKPFTAIVQTYLNNTTSSTTRPVFSAVLCRPISPSALRSFEIGLETPAAARLRSIVALLRGETDEDRILALVRRHILSPVLDALIAPTAGPAARDALACMFECGLLDDVVSAIATLGRGDQGRVVAAWELMWIRSPPSDETLAYLVKEIPLLCPSVRDLVIRLVPSRLRAAAVMEDDGRDVVATSSWILRACLTTPQGSTTANADADDADAEGNGFAVGLGKILLELIAWVTELPPSLCERVQGVLSSIVAWLPLVPSTPSALTRTAHTSLCGHPDALSGLVNVIQQGRMGGRGTAAGEALNLLSELMGPDDAVSLNLTTFWSSPREVAGLLSLLVGPPSVLLDRVASLCMTLARLYPSFAFTALPLALDMITTPETCSLNREAGSLVDLAPGVAAGEGPGEMMLVRIVLLCLSLHFDAMKATVVNHVRLHLLDPATTSPPRGHPCPVTSAPTPRPAILALLTALHSERTLSLDTHLLRDALGTTFPPGPDASASVHQLSLLLAVLSRSSPSAWSTILDLLPRLVASLTSTSSATRKLAEVVIGMTIERAAMDGEEAKALCMETITTTLNATWRQAQPGSAEALLLESVLHAFQQ